MAAITGTLNAKSEFAGDHKVLVIRATLTSASDTITLTAASHGGVASIEGLLGAVIKTGQTTSFAVIQVSYTGLVITVTSKGEAGLAATTFGDIEIGLLVKHGS